MSAGDPEINKESEKAIKKRARLVEEFRKKQEEKARLDKIAEKKKYLEEIIKSISIQTQIQ